MVSGKWHQSLTTFAVSFGSIIMGLLNVWPSYTSILYTSENSTILTSPMTDSEVSLLGSLPSLGAMIGTAVVGLIIDRLGRKIGGLAICIPYVLSWAVIGISSSSALILAARFFAGVSGGAYLVYGPIFISEVAEDSIRGLLASVPLTFYGIGITLSYILGWFCSYHTIIWLNMATSILACMSLLIVKESPTYLVRQKRDEEARLAMAAYRGVSPSSMVVLDEISTLKMRVAPAVELISINSVKDNNDPMTKEEEAEKLNADTIIDVRPKIPSWKLLYLSPAGRRAFFMLVTVISLQVFMGIVPVQVYAKHVFKEANPSQADLYSVVFGLVLIAGSTITGIIADKAGRRVLIISSSALVAICMISLGLQIQMNLAPKWITVFIIMLYCLCFMCGASTIPYILLAEVFAPEVQNIASMLIVEFVWFLNFFIIAVFPYLKKLLGLHGTFYVFAGFAIINSIFSYIYVPETKGLSNIQIQDLFLKRKK